MKFKTLFILMILFLGVSGTLLAQTTANHTLTLSVASIARIGVTAGVTLTVDDPGTAGDDPTSDSDNTGRLRYTSTVPSGQSRRITAEWGATDAAPAGTQLTLTATPGGGKLGSSAGEKVISSSAEDIITGVGSCATGSGAGNGAVLDYTLEVTDVGSLIAGDSEDVIVTFTITDAA